MTVQDYTFRAVLDSPGITTATAFTTDDGSGSGGRTIDAPPGDELLVAKVTFTNDSDRQEPFALAPTGTLPDTGPGQGMLILAVPQAEASSFGIPPELMHLCGTRAEPINAPAGYCSLGAVAGAFSPALVGLTDQPQLAPGANGTITLLGGGPATLDQPVSATARVSDAKLFVEKSQNCVLSGSPSCWAALN